MNNRRQIIVFLLTYFLLSSCISSQPTRSRRQKRGVLKMMMHIMWDPVRLIRYWYAYDVSKEIAKSWRKILPTILLLPVTQHMPHSHGLAKYVHPTIGVRDNDKKKTKHSSNPMVSFYQRTPVNTKPVALPSPPLLHQSLPSRYSFPQGPLQYYSAKQIKSTKQKNNDFQQVFVNHVPYEEDKDNNQYSFSHYFVTDSNSREEIPASNTVFLNEDHNTEEDIRPLSSQKVLYNERDHKLPSILQQNYLQFLPHEESENGLGQNENAQDVSPVLHPDQEFHIVLHPIPISDLNPNSLKLPPNEQTIHFVPVQLRSNDSYGANFDPSPILFDAFSQNRSEDNGEDQTSQNAVHFKLNPAKNNVSEGNASVSVSNTKSRVTWISQKNTTDTRRTDHKESDLQSGETKRRTVSLNFPENFNLNKDSTSGFSLNRNNINMERLREDLKHGTPVLIPFNKNVYSSDIVTGTGGKHSIIFPQNQHQNKNPYAKINQPKTNGAAKVPSESDADINSSSEHSGERNSTQRLLLFLRKREHLVKVPLI